MKTEKNSLYIELKLGTKLRPSKFLINRQRNERIFNRKAKEWSNNEDLLN